MLRNVSYPLHFALTLNSMLDVFALALDLRRNEVMKLSLTFSTGIVPDGAEGTMTLTERRSSRNWSLPCAPTTIVSSEFSDAAPGAYGCIVARQMALRRKESLSFGKFSATANGGSQDFRLYLSNGALAAWQRNQKTGCLFIRFPVLGCITSTFLVSEAVASGTQAFVIESSYARLMET
jgi:hypothetical protein